MRTRETKSGRDQADTRRAFALQGFKAVNDNAGIFEGYLACFGNLDDNGDIIDRGAFKKTLDEHYKTKERDSSQYLFPILWQHDEHDPIGGFTEAHEDDRGLYVKGELDLEAPNGKRAYSALKKGYLRGLSIGYGTMKSIWGTNHDRHLTEIKLFEGSPVTFPANRQAMVLTVKSASGKTDWPLAGRDVAWDNGAATKAIGDWAKKDDGTYDAGKLASVHFYKDADADGSLIGSYKLLFCDVIGGSVKAVPKAIQACTGAHGIQGVKGVSDADISAIKGKIKTYYGKMAKEFDDDSIKVPWEDDAKKEHPAVTEIKQMGGLQALTQSAVELDCCSDMAENYVEALAGTCGFSMEGPAGNPASPPVAALLGAVDGLPEAIQAVINAWQEFDNQTDALLAILGIPDDDDMYGPMYMSALRSASELKEGKPLSSRNRDRIQRVADGLDGHSEELKALLRETGKPDENANDVNIDQEIAAGKRTPKGNVFALDAYRRGVGLKPGSNDTTSSPAASEPDAIDESTLEKIDELLIQHELDAWTRRNGRRGE